MKFNKFLFTIGTFTAFIYGFATLAESQQPQPEDHAVHPLQSAQVLLVESLALTERGIQDPSIIRKTVTEKLEKAGFTVVSSPDQPHEAVVRVKCEERQTYTGPNKNRSISPALTSRIWKGPVCLISYRHNGTSPPWQWEVHTSFEDARTAAEAAGESDPGIFAMQSLNVHLQQDNFPLFLIAEWEQADRLVMLLEHATDQVEQQKTLLHLLGTLTSDKAFAALTEALTNPELAPIALSALGQQGQKAIPVLVAYLDATNNPYRRLTAIQALGTIASQSKSPALFTQFINLLEAEDPKIQTEAVKGLGNLGDRRAIQPLEKLNLKAWTNPSTSPDMQALREMLSWSLWQLKPDAHTGG